MALGADARVPYGPRCPRRILVTPFMQAALTALNYHWTLELVLKRLKGQKLKQL